MLECGRIPRLQQAGAFVRAFPEKGARQAEALGRLRRGRCHIRNPFGEARHPAAPAYFAETDGVVDASPLRPDQIPSTVQAFVAGIELFVDP